MKTLGRIQSKFYWPQMTSSVKNFVKHCRTCQTVNKKFRRANSTLHPIPHEVDRFWHFICIDCITNLPMSKSGCKHILTVTCKFTKFVSAKALPDIQAPTIAAVLYEFFCTFGWPSILLSDQGRESCYQIVDCLIGMIDRRTTSSYHPQTNGQSERWNQTLEAMLIKLVNEDDLQGDWDKLIPGCVYSYNTSKHATTGVSPFEAAFGHQGKHDYT